MSRFGTHCFARAHAGGIFVSPSGKQLWVESYEITMGGKFFGLF